MTSTNEIGLASERIQSSNDVDLHDIHCTTFCENVLWKPVSCQQCETHFCSTCITQWLNKNPNQCPMRCENFIQRTCSKFVARQLAKLQIDCIYRPNGCNDAIPYDALEKHELTCEYKPVQCSACQMIMSQKDWIEHQGHCQLAVKTCDNCQIVYKPNDVQLKHSDIVCLREQFQQYRFAAQNEIADLRTELQQSQRNQIDMLVLRGLIDDDNPIRRFHLQCTAETETLNRDRIVLSQNAATCFADELLCSTCRCVLWKPVYCGKCETLFCGKCRPQVGFFKSITVFFGAERPRHGPKNCENFEEAPIPNHIITDLRRLTVRCAYAPNGCPATPFYYELEYHEQNCEYEKVPCELCQKPLSQRNSNERHSTRACFEEMRRKNPSGVQQQFKILLDATERAEAENARLKTITTDLITKMNNLDKIYMRKPEKRENTK